VDVNTICLIGGAILYCVLAFYLLWNIFFSSSRCLSRSRGFFSLRRPSWSGRECVHEFTTFGIRARLTWRSLRSSSIFKSSIVSLISADGRLGWTLSLPKAGWRKHYSEGRKSLKTWRKKLGRNWIRKPWRLFNVAWWAKCWVSFLQSNNVLIMEAKTSIWRSR